MTASVLLVDKDIVGADKIAARLEVSGRTVRRLYRRGRLTGAFQLGGRTSPIRMAAQDIDTLRASRG